MNEQTKPCRFCGVDTPVEDLDRIGECPGCSSWARQKAREESYED